jgi:hypothetical protein
MTGHREKIGVMTAIPHDPDHGYTPPGVIQVSPAALQLARDFYETVKNMQGGNWLVVFDWATSVTKKLGPDQPSQDVPDGVMMGASKRHEVPAGFSQTVDGLEFAIQIPKEIWEKSAQRLIDLDKTQFFKLALR